MQVADYVGERAPVMSSDRVGGAGVGGNPVDFPRLAFVGGKCLLEFA